MERKSIEEELKRQGEPTIVQCLGSYKNLAEDALMNFSDDEEYNVVKERLKEIVDITNSNIDFIKKNPEKVVLI